MAQLSKAFDLKPHTMISQSMWCESQQRQSLSRARVTLPFILKWMDKIVAPAMHWCESNRQLLIYLAFVIRNWTGAGIPAGIAHNRYLALYLYTQGRKAHLITKSLNCLLTSYIRGLLFHWTVRSMIRNWIFYWEWGRIG